VSREPIRHVVIAVLIFDEQQHHYLVTSQRTWPGMYEAIQSLSDSLAGFRSTQFSLPAKRG
jgi:hypothetical protein